MPIEANSEIAYAENIFRGALITAAIPGIHLHLGREGQMRPK